MDTHCHPPRNIAAKSCQKRKSTPIILTSRRDKMLLIDGHDVLSNCVVTDGRRTLEAYLDKPASHKPAGDLSMKPSTWSP